MRHPPRPRPELVLANMAATFAPRPTWAPCWRIASGGDGPTVPHPTFPAAYFDQNGREEPRGTARADGGETAGALKVAAGCSRLASGSRPPRSSSADSSSGPAGSVRSEDFGDAAARSSLKPWARRATPVAATLRECNACSTHAACTLRAEPIAEPAEWSRPGDRAGQAHLRARHAARGGSEAAARKRRSGRAKRGAGAAV